MKKYPSYVETMEEQAGFDDLPIHKQAQELFDEELAKLEIKFHAVRIPCREDSGFSKDACHAHCTFIFKNGVTLASEYSAGKLSALDHVTTEKQAVAAYIRATNNSGHSRHSFSDVSMAWRSRSRYERKPAWQENVMDEIRKSWLPKPGSVFACLLTDATEETFEDFCDNFGYDSDSRKAERIWQQCREVNDKFIRVLGRVKMEEFQMLAREL